MILEFERESASLGKDAKYVAASKKRIDSYRIYRLLGHAQKLLFDADAKNKTGNIHRTRLCHNARAYQAETISVRIPRDERKSKASLSGVQTCGSIWACPICAKRIATQRGKEISQAIDYMAEAGNVAVMVSNTARHTANDSLAGFKNKFKAAHRMFVQSRRWRDLKSKFGIQHSIKAVEGTWGIENGWHYHQHSILFLNADLLNAVAPVVFSVWVEAARQLWLHCLEKNGLDGVGEIAFDVQADHDVKKNYLSKLGLDDETSKLDYELSAGHNKTSGGAKIWQILEKSWEGDALASKLYIEWVEAMSGDQWIVFSNGLKELCGILEVEDEDASLFDDIEEEVTNETLLDISDEEFMPVRKLQKVADLLELAANSRNADTVREWLRKLAIEWNNSGAGNERDRLLAQLKAMEMKRDNWRKGMTKSQNFDLLPALKELCDEIENLKRKVK